MAEIRRRGFDGSSWLVEVGCKGFCYEGMGIEQ